MANSKLATYTKLTANNSGKRTQKITKITPHYMAARWTAQKCADYFYTLGKAGSRRASSNYCVGYDGSIAVSVNEDNRAWTSSSEWNDQRAVTIECGNESDSSLSSACYKSLVALCADICKRHSITPHYDGTTNGTITMHKQFSSTTCLPIDTELLTLYGWVPITDVADDDLIASPHIDDMTITFAPIVRKVPVKEQDVYENHGLYATKDHNIVYSKQYSKDVYRLEQYKVVLAQNQSQNIYIPLAGKFNGEGLPLSDDMIKFLIAVQADGHYMRENKNSKPYGIEFHISKERKIERLLDIISKIGLEYTICKQSNGTTKIRIYNQDDINIVEDICERYLTDKCFNWDWLNLSKEQAVLFLDEILLWDGCLVAKKYSSTIKQNLDVVNAIAALNNVGSRVIGSDVMFMDDPYMTLSKDPERRLARKKVACVTSQTGLILVRQKGKTMIVGNCPGTWLSKKITSGEFEKDIIAYMGGSEVVEIYRVRKSWADAKSQTGAYKVLDNAKKYCKAGYGVYNSKGAMLYRADSDKVAWDYEAEINAGDTVKSKSCAIEAYGATGSAIVDDCVYVPALGGLVPLADITEASDTGDGANDNYLANTNSKITLDACKVKSVGDGNIVLITGAGSKENYYVKTEKLGKKVEL